MAFDVENMQIVDNPQKARFEAQLEGNDIAYTQYSIAGKNIIFTHTEVPIGYEGMGIGSKLARHVLDFARDEGYKVQPLCPFIKSYVNRHEEYQAISWGY